MVDSRLAEEGAAIRRRRECVSCGHRYTTFERIDEIPLMVIKRSGLRQPFDRGKLIDGLRSATKNRPVTEEQLETVAHEVEDELREEGSEPTSEQVGLAVLERLREVDEVAYLRFASVYKGFEGVDDFRREVGLLTKTTAPEAVRGLIGGRADRPTSPARALAIYAHPDDPDVSCGGTLAAWAKAGCEVRILLCTDGGKGSSDPSIDPAELAARRAVRGGRGGRVLGRGRSGLPQLPRRGAGRRRRAPGGAGGRSAPVPTRTWCSAPIPTAVFFGHDYFNHRDHRITGMAALDAVSPAAALPHYFPRAGPAHQVTTVLLSGTLEPDVWVDISSTVDVKGEAVGLSPEPVPRRRGVGLDGGEAGGRGRRPAGRRGLRRGVPEAAPRWVSRPGPAGSGTGRRGRPAVDRVILHVDMDAFFASVEVLDDPSLAGLPVIVGGIGTRGVVAACTYEARMFGVHSAMPSSVARRLCPDAVFVDGRFHRYVEESQRLHAIFHSVTPLVEGISLDEAFLDVSGSRHLLGDGPTIATAIRQRVAEELHLHCSVGVGRSKLMAKLASKAAKPTATALGHRRGSRRGGGRSRPGARVPPPAARPGPVGGGPGHRAAAGVPGHHRPSATWPRSRPDRSSGCLGTAQGRHLAELARGDDPRPVVPEQEAKSIGHEETFPSDLWDRAVLHGHLLRMVDASATALRRSGLAARTVSVKVRFGDFSHDHPVPLPRRPGRRRRRPSASVAAACSTRSSWTRVSACSGSASPGSARPRRGRQLSLDLDLGPADGRRGGRHAARRAPMSAGPPVRTDWSGPRRRPSGSRAPGAPVTRPSTPSGPGTEAPRWARPPWWGRTACGSGAGGRPSGARAPEGSPGMDEDRPSAL